MNFFQLCIASYITKASALVHMLPAVQGVGQGRLILYSDLNLFDAKSESSGLEIRGCYMHVLLVHRQALYRLSQGWVP